MLLLRALMRGMVGGYMILTLLIAVGAYTRLNDPKAALSFLEEVRWIPGAARFELMLRDAYSEALGTEFTASAEPVRELTPLQKLRERTWGNSSQVTLVRK